MNRIDFIKNIFLGALGLSSIQSFSGFPTIINNSSKNIKLITTNIAGFNYYEGPTIENNIKEGDTIQFKRTPNNPYDKNAIEIYWQTYKLGFIPKPHNKIIAQLMDSKKSISGNIRHINKYDSYWNRVYFGIYLDEAKTMAINL